MSPHGDTGAGGLEVRPREHVLLVQGREVTVTPREFEIAMRLAEHPGWVLSAHQLALDSEEGDYSPESVSVHVSRLRRKLASAGAPDVVETVRGFGYRLHATVDERSDSAGVPAGTCRALRDATWQLQQAALEVEHSGNSEQQGAATEAVDEARRKIYSILAE